MILGTLAALSRPPAWLAVVLLVLFCLVTAYGVVIVAHGRSLFPDELAGRGVTTVNLAQVVGCAGLPILTGAIIAAFPASGGGSPETGVPGHLRRDRGRPRRRTRSVRGRARRPAASRAAAPIRQGRTDVGPLTSAVGRP